MIIAGFLGQDTAPAAAAAAAQPSPTAAPPVPPPSPATVTITPPPRVSQGTRIPWGRPANARPNFIPRSLDTGFVPEFSPFPTVMLPPMARLPGSIHMPMRSDPGYGIPKADPSGQSSVPPQVPSPVAVKPGRMMPPGLIMALGIMPSVRGVRSGRVNPNALVAAGRKPSAV